MDDLSKQQNKPRALGQSVMPPPPYCRKGDKTGADSSRQGLSQLSLEVSDAGELLELCEKLNDGSTCALESRINKYLLKQSESETVFLIRLTLNSEEAVVQTVNWNILETPLRRHLNTALFSTLQQPETYLGGDLGAIDAEIQKLIERIVKKKHFNVVTVPVFKYKSPKRPDAKKMTKIPQVPYLVCLINPVKDKGYITKFVPETFRFTLPILINTLLAEEETRLKEQCLSLLAVARKLFSSLHDLHDLFREVMLEARKLMNAERCSLFLLDDANAQLVAKVFDGVVLDADKEVRIPKYQGVAGHVLKTGKLLNIKNAYEHPLFYKGMDDRTGFKTRNILCFPIRDENGFVGVAQLCNKKNGSFNFFDEEAAMAFSIYCGLSIMHSMVYKKIKDAQARSKLSNELMIYHMKVSESDVNGVLFCQKKHQHQSMEKFKFSPRFLPISETVCYVLAWYRNMGFVTTFRIHEETLVKFLIHIEKGYRDFKDAPYHNWMHAFSVAHFIYACLQTFDLIGKHYITALEGLALLTSAVCHDLDHRGTTNSFQVASESVLASLYSSEGSVMERHHLAQTLCTLNIEGCNFLESLGTDDYSSCLDLLRDMILATDLALHLKFLPRQLHIAQVGYDKHNKENRYLLVSLLMTGADLSDQTKDWANTRLIAQQVYAEFFKQGDLEKAMGKEPVVMMDREKANIPQLQIEFLNYICLPAYTILSMMFPEARILVDNINRSIKMWEASKSIFVKYKKEGLTGMEILTHRNFTDDIREILRVDEETVSE